MADRIWDYVNAVMKSKDRSVLKDPDFEKIYNAFIVNRSLSQHYDTVLAANLMNERSNLPPQAQFLFLLNTLDARFRKADWLKHTVSDDEKCVSEYYGCSVRHARGLVALHTSEQLTTIRARIDKGGAVGKRVPRHDNST